MIEREINLLAPHIIKIRSRRIYLGRLGHLVRFCIFLGLLLLVALGGVYLVVQRTARSLTSGTTATSDHTQDTVAEVQRLDAQLAAIKEWSTTNVPWTPLLPDVFAAMPAGVLLTAIGVQADTHALELEGTFPRREALVQFQRKLEGLPWVKEVKSPLSNFESGTNAQFTLHVWRNEGL